MKRSKSPTKKLSNSALASAAASTKDSLKRRGATPEQIAEAEVQLAAAAKAIEETAWTPLASMEDVRRRYGNADKADKVPREILYLDIGVLMGMVMHAQARALVLEQYIHQLEFDLARMNKN